MRFKCTFCLLHFQLPFSPSVPILLSVFAHSAPHSHLIYTKFNLLLALINHSAGSRCAIILIYATFTNSKFKLHTIQWVRERERERDGEGLQGVGRVRVWQTVRVSRCDSYRIVIHLGCGSSVLSELSSRAFCPFKWNVWNVLPYSAQHLRFFWEISVL